MLTASQVATAAYLTEDGTLLCPECFDQGDDYAKPIIQYVLDELQTSQAEGWLDWDYLDDRRTEDGLKYALGPDGFWHAEGCGCEPALLDDGGHVLLDAYFDHTCREGE